VECLKTSFWETFIGNKNSDCENPLGVIGQIVFENHLIWQTRFARKIKIKTKINNKQSNKLCFKFKLLVE